MNTFQLAEEKEVEAEPSQDEVQAQGEPLRGRIIHPALHLEEGWVSVGIKDQRGDGHIVAETRRIYDAEAIKDNLWPRPMPYPGLAARWPDEDLRTFMEGEKSPTFGEIVNLIISRARATLELPRSEHYSLLAAWVVGTYFHRLFLTFPRLALMGEKESGKSKTLAFMSTLSFNGLHRLAPTPAVLFRLIEALRPTLCLDEMEGLAREDRREILGIINAGYKVGGAVDRTEGTETRRVVSYDVYAPMALAGIRGLNETTEDRTIPIILQRGIRPDLLNAEVDPADPLLARIRGGLYRLLLTKAEEVRATYRDLPLPGVFTGRVRELWKPLLVIGALADWDRPLGVQMDLVLLAKAHMDDRGPISEETAALIGILNTLLGTNTQFEIKPLDLCSWMQGTLNRKCVTPEYVATMLRRLGFPRRRVGGRSRYEITADKLKELECRFQIPGETA